MIHKVIITEQGKILVDESAEINSDDYYVAWEDNYKVPQWVIYTLASELNGKTPFKLIGTINHSIDKDIPMVIVEDVVEIITETLCAKKGNENNTIDLNAYALGVIDGYKEAQQKGVYSEEDMKDALYKMYSIFMDSDLKSVMQKLKSFDTIKQNIIQSLNQEYIELKIEEVYSGETLASASGFSLKTDAIKTIKTDRVNGQLMAYVEQTFKL
jgi:hypothetical protein